MKPEQFIREQGLDKAREVVESAPILPCPECESDYCFEDGNNEESAIMCGDCGFEIVTNNVAKSKKKWNSIKRSQP